MNLDQVTNMDLAECARVAFKLVDKLQEQDKDKQLAGAALFMWALADACNVPVSRLLEAVDRAALDADRRQVPEVGGLVLYIKKELL